MTPATVPTPSTVAIIGGHGHIALLLTRLLSGAGTRVLGLVRNPAQRADIEAAGGTPVHLDIEVASAEQLGEAIRGADALLFAAGAGPGSGPARKLTVDLGGSVLAQRAADLVGVRRFVQLSAMVDRDPGPEADESWRAYVHAKREADADLRATSLDWTILRPGPLSFEAPTGCVRLGEPLEPGASASPVSRADVAAVLAALLEDGRSVRRTLDVVGGQTPIAVEVARVLA